LLISLALGDYYIVAGTMVVDIMAIKIDDLWIGIIGSIRISSLESSIIYITEGAVKNSYLAGGIMTHLFPASV
jgi:hypothetical protein